MMTENDLQLNIEKLQAELQAEKQKNARIKEALESFSEKVNQAENMANKAVEKKVRTLALFEKKMKEYYKAVCERYPISDGIVAMGEFLEKLETMLLNEYNIDTASLDDMPQGAFDIEAALNPDEDLESLCKDLGLI